jgi:hypothetical protein
LTANHPPTIAWSITPSGPTVANQAVPAFTAQASDADTGQALSIQFYIGDQAVGGPQSGASATLSGWSPANAGVYQVRAVVSDAAGGTATASILHAVTIPPNAGGMSLPATASVGTIPGTFAVTDSGAATYSIPIQLPPGAGGLQPSLTLAYSSQGGDGLAGAGWSLGGLSTIYRCPKNYATDGTKATIQYDVQEGQAYCLDGERLIEISSTGLGYDSNDIECNPLDHPEIRHPRTQREYRTERNSYARIRSMEDQCRVWGPAGFEVYTKSGQILYFGTR